MFYHVKELQFNARVSRPDPAFATLLLLRNACMLQGKNIAKETVLHEIASELEKDMTKDFSLQQFKADLKTNAALNLFRKDLDEVASLQSLHIHRFPTLVIKRAQRPSLLLKGFRSAEAIMEIAEL